MPDIRISPCLQLGLLILFSILIHVLAKCAYKLATTVSNVIAFARSEISILATPHYICKGP